jgi:hypothetical protein
MPQRGDAWRGALGQALELAEVAAAKRVFIGAGSAGDDELKERLRRRRADRKQRPTPRSDATFATGRAGSIGRWPSAAKPAFVAAGVPRLLKPAPTFGITLR